MLKPLTLSLTFAAAFALSGVSRAGGLFHTEAGCTTCGLASPQGGYASPVASYGSPQTVLASGQGGECGPVCNDGCGEKKKCHLGAKMSGCFSGLCAKLKPKPKTYTYEWVLKKKRVKGCGGCASPACETCSTGYPVTGSPQGTYAAPQGSYAAPQAGYTSPQAYANGQIAVAPTSGVMSAPAPAGDEAPPAPEVAPAAPPAPPAPSLPAPPAPPAPAGPMSSLLFSTPSAN